MPTFFRIKGTVAREPFSTEKFARVSILVYNGDRKAYFDVKTFESRMITTIRDLRVGEEVSIDGELMSETVKDGRESIKDSRGREIWAVGLKATKMSPASSDGPATERPASKSPPPTGKTGGRDRSFDDGEDAF